MEDIIVFYLLCPLFLNFCTLANIAKKQNKGSIIYISNDIYKLYRVVPKNLILSILLIILVFSREYNTNV